MNFYPIVFLVSCIAYIEGFLFRQCQVKVRVQCGHSGISLFECRMRGCCYKFGWTANEPTCYKNAANVPPKPAPRRPRFPEYPWLSKTIPTQSANKLTLHTYTANTRPAWKPTTPPSGSVCIPTGARIECGYPGINSKLCQARGCCWDDTVLGVNWCFHKTLASTTTKAPSSSFFNQMHNLFSQKSKFGNKSPAVNPPITLFWTLPTTMSTTTTEKPNFIHENTGKKLTPEEQMFYLQVNKELMKLGKATTPTPSYFAMGGANRRLTGDDTFARRHNQLIRTTTTTTTITTAMKRNNVYELLVPNTHGPATGGDLARGFTPVQLPSKTDKFRQAIAFFKLLSGSKGDNGPAPSSSNVERCELETPDSCCLANPNGTCCGYSRSTRLSDRPAPLPRVVGGTPAGRLRYSVAHLSRLPFKQHFCGGTLLNREWVLTAAHCVLSYCERFTHDLVVNLGKYQKLVSPREKGQQEFNVIRVICHPYQCLPEGKPRYNDVALLQLSRPAVYTSVVQPTLLPHPYEEPLANRNCMALGWGNTKGSGYPNVLKEVSVPAFSNEQCTHSDWRGCLVKSCMICAGDVNTDPCDGDSGGPLFCQRSSGLYVLHGIYSWGRCGAKEKKPSIYTRSAHFIDWIHTVIRS